MTEFQKEVGIAAVLCFFFFVFFLCAGTVHIEKTETNQTVQVTPERSNQSCFW